MSVDAAAEEQFGPYLVYERLGIGGMATVHRALEQGAEGFERIVALKRLLPHLAEDASFIKSFVREAKLASILNHVNIVQIYELGRVGTEYFISMEYIDGRDLRRILRHARKVTGPPPINVTVGLMLQLCDALDYAHSKVDEDGSPLGLVHRDISPSNLIVTSAGHLKIIDFGIAKAQSSQLRTHTGRVKGKLAYMAPEAVSGSRDLDSRSDLWACGVILHELLTARPLFASKNEYQTLLKVQRGDIEPPSTFNQACPPELDAIVARALAREMDQRCQNAGALREALMRLKQQKGLQTGYRDISKWLDWAFALEPPASFSASPDSSGVQSVDTPKNVRAKTVRPPRNIEEDEAVEVVWGGGNVESEDGPVVLEDVPDVSEKHQRPKPSTEEMSAQFDDIPTPPPSHGTMPSIYGSEHGGGVPQTARSSEQMRAQRASGPHTIPRGASGPVAQPGERRARTTSQGVTVPARSQSDRMRAQSPRSQSDRMPAQSPRSQSDRMPAQSPTSQSDRMLTQSPSTRTGPTPRLDAPQLNDRMAAQRARDTGTHEPPRASTALGVRPPTESGVHSTDPHRARTAPGHSPSAASELFGEDAADVLARVAETDAAVTLSGAVRIDEDDEPTLSPSRHGEPPSGVPVVRFARSQTTPPGGVVDAGRPRSPTRQGAAPARAVTAPGAPTRAKPPSNIRIGESIASRAKPRRTWLYVLGGLVLVGGAAAGIGMFAGSRASDAEQGEQAVTTPVRETGTVRFMTEPEDAEIKIAGELAHAGSPWSTELAAGVHQIEIHRTGYKSWLTSLELSANETQTLRVVLEPLTAKAVEASLTITTTPPGLEVVIDGKVQDQKTPFKSTLAPGLHEITVRQNGSDVWHQRLEAEASSNYEFNPSFTADKQRERAQRAPKPAPPLAPSKTEAVAKPAAASPAPEPEAEDTPASSSPAGAPAPAATVTPSVAATIAKPAPPPPVPAPKPPTPAPKQQVAAPAAPPPSAIKRPTAPRIVPPAAVKKLSGEQPSIAKFKNLELPAVLAAKMCIDTSGKVTSAKMMTKLEPRVAADLVDELRGWRYAPYKQSGTAIPVCFVVTFRAR